MLARSKLYKIKDENSTSKIIKGKLVSISVCCKNHRIKTANIKRWSANFKHKSWLFYL